MADRTVLIACCSDSGRPAFRQIVKAINGHRPDVVLFGGDARPDGFGVGALAGRRWVRTWGDLAGAVLAVPGNHDYPRGSRSPFSWAGEWSGHPGFRSRGAAQTFVLELDVVTIIGFDTGPRAEHIDSTQLGWAHTALAGTDPTIPRVALFHGPAFPVSRHIGSSLDARPRDRDALWATLEDLGVSLAVNGHEHLYARREIMIRRPITQVIVGGAGAELTDALSLEAAVAYAQNHFLLVSASRSGLAADAIALDGTVLDRFSVSAPATYGPVGPPRGPS